MTGKELKGKVYANDLTQKELAIKLGCSQQSLVSIFKAKDVKSGTIEKIAEIMNVPVSFLYGEDMANITSDEHISKMNGSPAMATRIEFLERLLEEKDKMIKEKERTIQILLNKQKSL